MIGTDVKPKRISINFKLPEDLLEVARVAAKERETTLTALVIQGLHRVLDLPESADSNADVRLYQLEQDLVSVAADVEAFAEAQHGERLSYLEQKLEAFTFRLEQLERTVASNRYSERTTRSKPKSFNGRFGQPQNLELQPFPHENLAQRLGLMSSTLLSEREKMTSQQFISWTRNRDPRGLGWEYHPQERLYYPVK